MDYGIAEVALSRQAKQTVTKNIACCTVAGMAGGAALAHGRRYHPDKEQRGRSQVAIIANGGGSVRGLNNVSNHPKPQKRRTSNQIDIKNRARIACARMKNVALWRIGRDKQAKQADVVLNAPSNITSYQHLAPLHVL